MNSRKILFVAALAVFVFANSCKRDEIIIGQTDFPRDIAYILQSKCISGGCHNSTDRAGQLDVTSWNKLFEGSDAGAVVIPYRADYSSLLYFVNTYPDLGITTTNKMPKNGDALTRDEVNKLKSWVSAGAPDSKGNIKFLGNPNRKKYYVVNQGCRVVTVFDAQTNLPMRYIDIADATEQNTSPHMVKLSPDGQYWYVCFIGGSYIKRFKTIDDSYAGKIFVGNASWNTMTFTPDSKSLFAVEWPGGKAVKCDLTSMLVIDSVHLADAPHGCCVSPDGINLFITATGGNYLYKINIDSLSKPASYNQVAFDISGPSPSNQYNPHEVIFSHDGTKYYVSCSGNNNAGDLSVKVFDSATDNLIKSIPLNAGGYEMSISVTKNLLFVTSYDGIYMGTQGRVAVIDLATNTLHAEIATGTQPHGIAVDDAAGLVYVANRNVSNATPPHHTSVCGGVNGNLVFIDLNSLTLLDKVIVLSRDPYSVNIRF
ncbi:MAG TPA: hypothetical protein VNZ49_13070 [Bacteroidia bacterium]|jgi:DNA-binding beta-propeller fold protein YncE|nr:hypothetical protein [Bacteroidia bacterium]